MPRKESLTSQAIKGSFWKTISSIIQRAGGLVFTIILARILLPEKFGLYNLVISVAFLFMAFSQGGIDETFIRYLSESIAKNDKEKAKSYFRYILKLKILMIIIVCLLLAILSYPLANYAFNKPIIFIPLLISAAYIFSLSLESTFSALFFVLKRVKYTAVKESILQVTRIIIVLAALILIVKSPSVTVVFLALLFSSLITLFFVLYKNFKLSPFLFSGKYKKITGEDKKRILKFMIYTAIGTISLAFFGYIDTVMLGILIPNAEYIGFYRAAFIAVSSVGGFLTFGSVLLPILMQVSKERLEYAFNKVFRYLMIVTVPAAFGLATLGNYFIVLIYGYAYQNAALPLYILSFSMIFAVQVVLFSSLFSKEERPGDFLPLLGITLFINIVLNYILITWLSKYSLIWGMSGAAIATTISWAVYATGFYHLLRKRLKINTEIAVLVKPLIASIIMSGVIIYTKSLISDLNIFSGILLVILGIIAYFVMLISMKGLKKDDLSIIKTFFRK